MLNKIAISKFLLDVFGEMVSAGGGFGTPQSLSTIKMGTGIFNFQSN